MRLAAALVLLAGVGVLGLAATINQFAIVDAVNAKLPTDDHFNPFGWWLPKILRLHREYRRLYPGGSLVRREGMLATAMLGCTLLTGTLIGLGLPSVAFFGALGAFSLWFMYFRK